MSDAVITVVGNVARQIENRNTNSGAKVCKFVVASSRSWMGEGGWEQSEPSYFDVECWGKLAENVSNTLWKGQAVIVSGNIRTDSWTADNGETRYRQKIVAKAVGPNLRRHVASVKTLTEKPHEEPVGAKGFGEDAGSSGAAPAERREPALVGAGVSGASSSPAEPATGRGGQQVAPGGNGAGESGEGGEGGVPF
nr:single-stranded DNA-binding protein [Corynebacterium lactis]